MMTRNCALLVALLTTHTVANAAPVSWSLAGEWQVQDANDSAHPAASGWRPLQVPANWYSAGYDHQGALWYKHAFSLPVQPPDVMSTLVFDGVDYLAEVTLNGQPLGQHEGYFQRFSLDAGQALQRHNRLVVRVDSPYEDPNKIWPLHKTVMKGILNQHDTRPGGAWSPQGQDANSGGIWAP
ncbi:glycosyl hydrolase 2 galactose-binding domain-containing protein, partial [Enterobacter roggenkampii]